MSRMIAGFSSMLLLSLYGSIVSHADLVGAVSLLSVSSSEQSGPFPQPGLTPVRSAEATLSDYPGAQSAGVSGTIRVDATAAELVISGTLSGLPVDTTAGFHIHAGVSCASKGKVGGHWYNGTADPWLFDSTYTSDSSGSADLRITKYAAELGENPVNSLTHAVVVHNADGIRIACGVLDSGFGQLRGSEISATYGVLTPPMIVDGEYILVPDSGGRRKATLYGEPSNVTAVFTVFAKTSTTVNLEWEVLMATDSTDSFFVWFDERVEDVNKKSSIWRPFNKTLFTSFTWAYVNSFVLDEGYHTLYVAVREEGAKLRKLRIKEGDALFTNLLDCPFGFFSDDTQTCQDAHCAIPANADAKTGLCVCDPGRCSSGFYSSDVTKEKCQDAHCAIPANANAKNGVCSIGGCSPGFFLSDGDLCRACFDPSCDVCASDECTDCSDGFILDDSGNCVEKCPLGQYGVVDTDLQCTACNKHNKHCHECDHNKCLACSSGYILDFAGKRCVTSCPSPQYGVVDKDAKCKVCGTNGSILNAAGTCVDNCPSGQYKASETECKACADSNCHSCPSGTCTECLPDRGLILDKMPRGCSKSCPKGQYGDTYTQCTDMSLRFKKEFKTDQWEFKDLLKLVRVCPSVQPFMNPANDKYDMLWDLWCSLSDDTYISYTCKENDWMLKECESWNKSRG